MGLRWAHTYWRRDGAAALPACVAAIQCIGRPLAAGGGHARLLAFLGGEQGSLPDPVTRALALIVGPGEAHRHAAFTLRYT